MALIDAISTPIFVVQYPLGIIVSMNSKAEELSGFSFDEAKGKNLSDFFEEKDSVKIEQLISNAIHANDYEEQGLVFRRKSRRTVLTDVYCKKIKSSPHTLIVFSVYDVEKFKKIEKSAKRILEVLNATFDELESPVLILNDEFHVKTANPATLKFFGISREALHEFMIDKLFRRIGLLDDKVKTKLDAHEVLSFKDVEFVLDNHAHKYANITIQKLSSSIATILVTLTETTELVDMRNQFVPLKKRVYEMKEMDSFTFNLSLIHI